MAFIGYHLKPSPARRDLQDVPAPVRKRKRKAMSTAATNPCHVCGLPEAEHYFDRLAWGCRAFDGQGDHPKRHIPVGRKSNIFVNGLKIGGLVGAAYLMGLCTYLLISGIINFLKAQIS